MAVLRCHKNSKLARARTIPVGRDEIVPCTCLEHVAGNKTFYLKGPEKLHFADILICPKTYSMLFL